MTLRPPHMYDKVISGRAGNDQALQVQGDFIITDATGTNMFAFDASGPTLTLDAAFNAIFDFGDNDSLAFGDGTDITMTWDATKLVVDQAAPNSAIYWGVSGAGIDQLWYGDTVAANMTWDQSANTLIFGDAAKVSFGTGSDVTFSFDGTDLLVTQAAPDSIIKWGVDGAGINHVFYGDTASATLTWDQTTNALVFAGVAKMGAHRIETVAIQSGAVSITSATSGMYHILGGADTAVTLPAVATSAGCIFHFIMTSDHEIVFNAPANTLVAPNDATATSVTYTTAGEQIGVACTIWCDGTLYYFMNNLPLEAFTGSVA